MNSPPLKETLSSDAPLSRENKTPRKLPFPKISEIDPDEPKKKKESYENISPFQLAPLEIKPSSPFLRVTPLLTKEIAQLTGPISVKLTLQKENGILRTHFIIQTKTFGEVEIKITMYDTAPHSFHILLLGNERIRDLSMQHQNLLAQQIQTRLPLITVHMGTPRLRKMDRFQGSKKKVVVNSRKNSYIAPKEG